MHRRDDRGASAVEFAFISIPFLVLVIGMIQYGWYFYVSQSTGGAASNVVRRLQVGDCWSGTEATVLARSQAPMVSSVVKSPSTKPTIRGTEITVTVTADAEIIGLVPLPGGGTVTKVVVASFEDPTSKPC
jgi:Flp pilus assembly protein TadG